MHNSKRAAPKPARIVGFVQPMAPEFLSLEKCPSAFLARAGLHARIARMIVDRYCGWKRDFRPPCQLIVAKLGRWRLRCSLGWRKCRSVHDHTRRSIRINRCQYGQAVL